MDAETLISLMSAKAEAPNKQLLSLFDLLSEAIQHGKQVAPAQIFNAALNKYCVKLSQQTRAHHPKILADHILFIAQNAYQQEVAHPENKSLAHAKKVAQALLQAQTQVPTNVFQQYWQAQPWLVGGTSLGLVLIAGLLTWQFFHQPPAPPVIATHANPSLHLGTAPGITAHEASAMYTKFEMMRNGTCRYIEAIQIPDQDKAVYLESVVGGKLPTNLKDLATANAYLEKIDCNYKPMLMQKSK